MYQVEAATVTNQDWFFLSTKIKKERAEKITLYAKQYLEPVLQQFPELKGNVHLLLRKEGWFAHYKPVFHIVIREEDLTISSEWRVRFITAHELLHLVQYQNGIGVNQQWNVKQIERQATFLSFARGFAYDFLKAFPAQCPKEVCDHQFKFSYYRCDKVFKGCCKQYPEEEFKSLSKKLEKLAGGYGLFDNPDYIKIVYECLILQ